MALLTYYGDTGKFEEVKSNAGDIVMDSFKKKEYIRLKNAVEQLLNLQKELHKKSGSIYLSQDDEKEMVTKACMIGFQTDDGCIAEVIRGNEIKLGYSLKQEIAIRNKLTQIEQMLEKDIDSHKTFFENPKPFHYGLAKLYSNKKQLIMDLKENDMVSGGDYKRLEKAKRYIEWANLKGEATILLMQILEEIRILMLT